ncbi:thioesterase family protein [Polaromonas sp. UC242_47]|uniref:thioesterase family protein n=1 Tax=Polaromonas sp. UC242_47 TaxID=3374626 RepID=UPI003797604D
MTIVWALLRYRSASALSPTVAHFFVTPLDTGLATLKSDRYLQMAESAQFDYVIKTALIHPMLAKGYSFVNASQLVKFVKPVRLFQRVRVESRVMYADDKCAWFCHTFTVRHIRHAEVLVKMKFKQGGITVPPEKLLGVFKGAKPAAIQAWDEALAAIPQA